jgi:hypothetical protein
MGDFATKGRERIRRRVSQLTSGELASARHLVPFFEFLRTNDIRAFLFGGTLRDFALHCRFKTPRDLDIVVDSEIDAVAEFIEKQQARLQSRLKTNLRKNRFGGLKVMLHGHQLDIWQLKDTWAFQQNLVLPPLFERLPQTTFLNLDAIVFELFPSGRRRGRQMFEHGFFSGIEYETLELNLVQNPYPELCVARAIILAHTTGFKIGPRLSNYVSEAMKKFEPDLLESIQEHHYGVVRRGARDFVSALDLISKNLSSNPERPVDILSAQFELHWAEENAVWSLPESSDRQIDPRSSPAPHNSSKVNGERQRRRVVQQLASWFLSIWKTLKEKRQVLRT